MSLHNERKVTMILPLITPSFRGDLARNADQLCDYFLALEESAVPVEAYTITSDGVRQTFAVEYGRYKTALWLLYNAMTAKASTYELTRTMKRQLPLYYGDERVIDAKRPGTEHQTLRLLLGDQVDIELQLRAGYELPRFEGRTLRELIEFGWQSRDAIEKGRISPLISGAVGLFMDQVAGGRISVIDSADPNEWPSLPWLARVKTLAEHLKIDEYA